MQGTKAVWASKKKWRGLEKRIRQERGENMEFPKPIMRMSELMEMGFPEECLLRAYRDRNQNFASKINPAKKNSPIIFDTEGLEKWWSRQISAQVRAMPRG